MPGKVNPVIPEAVTMVAAQVMGNHTTITVSGQGSIFELNVMMPVMAYALLQSVALLTSASKVLAEKCVNGIAANEERCRELLEGNLSLATALAPRLGYDEAAAIAKQAFKEGKTAREVARERSQLAEAELEKLLDARAMTEPGIPGGGFMPGGG
jgi:fumarate hydratase class II